MKKFILKTTCLLAALLCTATARAQTQVADSLEKQAVETVADSLKQHQAAAHAHSPELAPTGGEPLSPDDMLMAGEQRISADSLAQALGADSLAQALGADSIVVTKKRKEKRDWSTWKPDPKRAMWLAIVIPGAGQIYNRKYWKLPIIYGGFMGCLYALNWNNQMYHDYAQAYLDIMDDDPNTHSYDQFMHLGNQITAANQDRYKDLFKKRKDRYRRWRDLSVFVMIGIYAFSVIDAYVDASLSEFDISKDLSMKLSPTMLNNQSSRNPLRSSALGLQCSLNF